MTLPAIGLVGAGLMGAGIAGCLLEAGHPLRLVAHRNRAPVESLLARGAAESAGPQALLADVEVLFTCLPNAEVVAFLAEELLPHIHPGQIWIDVTTSRPETSEWLARALAERGAIFADAPVTGGPAQAEAGELASLVGCDAAHFARVEALLRPYSKVIRRFGDPGRGHAAKLLNNLVTQGTTVLLADAFRAAQTMGVDTHALYDVMMTGAARSGTLEKTVALALDGDYTGARFTIANAGKDLRYARDLLAGLDATRAPLAALLADRLGALIEAGRGDDFVSTMLDPARDTKG